MTREPDFAAANAILASAERILVVTHVDPDGDAIGSLLGLGNALRAAGHEVLCAVDGGVPAFLQFLPRAQDVHASLPDQPCDLLITVDANAEDRVGRVGAQARARCKTVINLDHHISNTGFGDIQLVMPEAAAATEVVWYWLCSLSLPLTGEVAQPLLTGLVTDTLGFRTSNVNARTLRVALELMKPGISLYDVVARTLESQSWSEVQLWQAALPSTSLEKGVAAAQISLDDYAGSGLKPGEDGDLPSYLRRIEGVRVAVVFRELAGDQISISMRSKPPWDVARVAQALGGGGHAQAAGATIAGSLAEARARALPLLYEAAGQSDPAPHS